MDNKRYRHEMVRDDAGQDRGEREVNEEVQIK